MEVLSWCNYFLLCIQTLEKFREYHQCPDIKAEANDSRFEKPAKDEIEGLLQRGSYVVVLKSRIPKNATILKSRIDNTIKTDQFGYKKFKTRLIIKGHKDPDKGTNVTEAPTILRSSRRIILSISQSLGFHIWSRDVKQAFIQFDFPLKGQLYVKPPKVPNLLKMVNQPSDGYLHALTPIYGLSESPGYWWLTFKRYHIEDLEMDQSTFDPCLFYRKIWKALIGLVGTLVDDTLAAGNHEFSRIENEKCKAFDLEPRDQELPLKFYGINITKQNSIMMTEQFSYIGTPAKINPNLFSKDQFSHLRGQVAYAAQGTRPDVAY